MAWIKLSVENIEEAGKNMSEHVELEGIIFEAEDGKTKKYKLKAMVSQTCAWFRHMYPEYDWDEYNIHVAIIPGEEIK